jgi:uncharacterized protein YuzE
MGEKLNFFYDREADVLYLSQGNPYPEQDSQEIGDDIVARLNPKTREVEGITILNFSRRFTDIHAQAIPIIARMQLATA